MTEETPHGQRRFTRRREDFTCLSCGHQVLGSGYTNHCPMCLWSRHVDVLPGDRMATCLGMMRPVGVRYERGEFVIVQRCVECGHTWRNRAAPGDGRDALLALAGGAEPGAEPGRGTPGRRAAGRRRQAAEGRTRERPGSAG